MTRMIAVGMIALLAGGCFAGGETESTPDCAQLGPTHCTSDAGTSPTGQCWAAFSCAPEEAEMALDLPPYGCGADADGVTICAWTQPPGSATH